MRKHVMGVSDEVRHKPGCTAVYTDVILFQTMYFDCRHPFMQKSYFAECYLQPFCAEVMYIHRMYNTDLARMASHLFSLQGLCINERMSITFKSF